ncbi:MAG: PilN domain-containing protein [Ignavibacteria bacterium]
MKKYVGIYIDGPETKVAIVSKTSKGLRLEDIITYGLKGSPHEFYGPKKTELEIDSDTILFEPVDETEGETEEPMLSNVLSGKVKNIKDITFVPVVTEPQISYLILNNVPKLKEKELKQYIIDKWLDTKVSSIDEKNLRYYKYKEDTYLTVYINESFPVLEQIEKFASFWKMRTPRIPFISAGDVCLTSYVLNKYNIQPDKNYLIVYIGIDSSRIIFISNKTIKHISSYLGIGVQTVGFHDIIISKINLEMDVAQISDIDKIFLAGEVVETTVQLTFYGSFPLAEVEVIKFDELDLSNLPEEKREQIPVYAFCIAPLFFLLQEGKFKVPRINLLPYELIEAQKIFKLSPVGYALLFLIFIAVAFFTQKFITNKNKIQVLQTEIQSKQLLIAENAEIVNKVNQLSQRIDAGLKIQRTIDTLILGAERWTEILMKIQEYQPDRRRIWLTSFAASTEEVKITGVGVNKYTIPDFSDHLDKALLKSMISQELRDREINRFEITLNPEKYGYKGVQ